VGAGDADVVGNTNGNDPGTGIYPTTNSHANVSGSGNGVDENAIDSMGIYGGGNNSNTVAGALPMLGNTGGNLDQVNATGDQWEGTTAKGQGTGIYINNGAQANVAGGNDGISLIGTGDYFGLLGGAGYSVSDSGNSMDTWGYTGLALTGDSNNLGLGGVGDYLGVAGNGNNVSINSGTVNLLRNGCGRLLARCSGGNLLPELPLHLTPKRRSAGRAHRHAYC
jgi:hypothetical protein